MGGLRCAKEIIDQRNALVHQLDCMVASINLSGSADGSGVRPSYEDTEEFQKAAKVLSDVAANIQKKVGGGQ